MINVGSDFSGVGAFDQALRRLSIEYKTVFACDMDKYARQTYVENYGEPDYYPENVYDREIPKKPLDVYMTSPPCQSFSLAGKRKGEDSLNGVLFYNSHEFIMQNNPMYFIFENVKGLLSDAKGRTFQIWLDMLGGKSVNGNPVIFPREDAAPYHIYHKVLNAKHFGVPQNRERVFIIGIRDDADNNFKWPKPFHLTKRLKDVLENEVDEKYYLSDKMINYLTTRSDNFNNGKINYKNEDDTASCLNASSGSIDISDNIIKIGFIKQDTQASQVICDSGTSSILSSGTHGYAQGYVKVNSANKKGYETVMIGAFRGRGEENNQELEINKSGTSNTIASVQKDNVVILHNLYGGFGEDIREFKEYSPAIRTAVGGGHIPSVKQQNHQIRRLTPRECFRLMDFPDIFTWPVSDTQAYKQAGNSIVVNVLAEIINKLKL